MGIKVKLDAATTDLGGTTIYGPYGAIRSLRTDEIKLWLTPSAKQRRNPCSGLPAVYPDLSTRHDWPVKKGLCFVCRDRQSGWRGIQNALPVIESVGGPEQGSLRCFADGTNQSLVIVCTQARPYAAGPGIVFELSVLNIHSSKAWRTKAKEIILRHIGLYSPKPEAAWHSPGAYKAKTSDANHFVNAKSHAREKPLLAG